MDKDKPLILCCADTMSEKAQKNIVNFIEDGGKVYILSTLPSLNESFECCTILKDYLGDIVEDMQVVLSGLNKDDKVVVQGLQKVQNGAPVQPTIVLKNK